MCDPGSEQLSALHIQDTTRLWPTAKPKTCAKCGVPIDHEVQWAPCNMQEAIFTNFITMYIFDDFNLSGSVFIINT